MVHIKNGIKPNCKDEQISNVHTCMHIHIIYNVIVVLSEINQTQRNKYYIFSVIQNLDLNVHINTDYKIKKWHYFGGRKRSKW